MSRRRDASRRRSWARCSATGSGTPLRGPTPIECWALRRSACWPTETTKVGRTLTLIPTLILALTLTLILRTQEASRSSYYLLTHLLAHYIPLTTYHQGSVEIELHMKSFSPRGETRSPDISAAKAEAEGRGPGGGGGGGAGGGGTASSIDSLYDSPYRTPVEPRRVLVCPMS